MNNIYIAIAVPHQGLPKKMNIDWIENHPPLEFDYENGIIADRHWEGDHDLHSSVLCRSREEAIGELVWQKSNRGHNWIGIAEIIQEKLDKLI
jgi:hypothetical protein